MQYERGQQVEEHKVKKVSILALLPIAFGAAIASERNQEYEAGADDLSAMYTLYQYQQSEQQRKVDFSPEEKESIEIMREKSPFFVDEYVERLTQQKLKAQQESKQ